MVSFILYRMIGYDVLRGLLRRVRRCEDGLNLLKNLSTALAPKLK